MLADLRAEIADRVAAGRRHHQDMPARHARIEQPELVVLGAADVGQRGQAEVDRIDQEAGPLGRRIGLDVFGAVHREHREAILPAQATTLERGGSLASALYLGVIGLGAIGSRVANCAIELGMKVYGYDPYISIDAAWNLSS